MPDASSLIDFKSLSVEAQMEIGAKMAFSANPVKHFAPYIMGMWFDAIMLGAVIVLYAQWKRNTASSERSFVRWLVYYFMVVSFGISCYILAYQMKLFVKGFGQYAGFLDTKWARAFYTVNILSRIPAAGFFSHRAWLISNKSPIIPILTIPLLLASLSCAVAATAVSTSYPLKKRELYLVISFIVTEIAADLINTTAIAIGLFKARTGWSATNRLVSRLLVLLAETATPPALMAIALLISWTAFTNSTAVSLFVASAKVHVICLMVVLNSRTTVDKAMPDGSVGENNSFQQVNRLNKHQPIVTVETHTSSVTSDPHTLYSPRQSAPDSKGQLRSVNGRLVGGDAYGKGGEKSEPGSMTSLV